MNTYILHHNDADGFGAAYSAWLIYGNDATYIPVEHGKPIPEIPDNSVVYVLDFSYPEEVIKDFTNRMWKFQLLDHHKSAFERIGHLPNCYFDMNRSGAGIAYDWFVGNERPYLIDYIEDQDLWKFKLENSKYIRESINAIPLNLESYIEAFKVPIEDRIFEGKILSKQLQYNLDRCFENVHVIQIDEFKMLAVNVCLHQSNIGNYLQDHIEKYGCDFSGCYYRMDQDQIKFSLRSRGDFDVSLICKRFNGGGHKNASGFQIPVSKFNFNHIHSK